MLRHWAPSGDCLQRLFSNLSAGPSTQMSRPNRQPVKKLSFGGRTRFAARRPFLCPSADRLPDGPGLGQSVVLRFQMSSMEIGGVNIIGIRDTSSRLNAAALGLRRAWCTEPHAWLVHLSSGSEHAAGGESARPRRDPNDSALAVRKGRKLRSVYRPASILTRCCRSATQWAGSGLSAVLRWPMSSSTTGGASPIDEEHPASKRLAAHFASLGYCRVRSGRRAFAVKFLPIAKFASSL